MYCAFYSQSFNYSLQTIVNVYSLFSLSVVLDCLLYFTIFTFYSMLYNTNSIE